MCEDQLILEQPPHRRPGFQVLQVVQVFTLQTASFTSAFKVFPKAVALNLTRSNQRAWRAFFGRKSSHASLRSSARFLQLQEPSNEGGTFKAEALEPLTVSSGAPLITNVHRGLRRGVFGLTVPGRAGGLGLRRHGNTHPGAAGAVTRRRRGC